MPARVSTSRRLSAVGSLSATRVNAWIKGTVSAFSTNPGAGMALAPYVPLNVRRLPYGAAAATAAVAYAASAGEGGSGSNQDQARATISVRLAKTASVGRSGGSGARVAG